ncbi:MAG: hypothetical protein ACPGXK_03465, partial [Phycisphaerae bacterium]
MQKMISGIVLLGALGIAAGSLVLVPSLQNADRAVSSESSRLMERGRWLLHRYQHGLAHKSLMLDSLAAGDVDVDVEDVDALLDRATDDYQETYEARWADYQPKDYQTVSDASEVAFIARDKSVSVGNLAGTIEKGVSERNALIEQNEALLDEAMRAVDEALAYRSGSSSAQDAAEANRLKGVIYYHKGVVSRHEGRHYREEATLARNDLRMTGLRLQSMLQMNLGGAADSLSEQIKALESKKSELETTLADSRKSLEEVASLASDLEKDAAKAEARAQVLLREMAELREEGVDFSDPDGSAVFEQKMRNLSDEYREVAREAASLMYGHLPKAEIDWSGDYVAGSYVEGGQSDGLTTKLGAVHQAGRRSILESTVASLETAVASMSEDIERLKDTRSDAMARAGIVDEVTRTLKSNAEQLFEQMAELDSLAGGAEDQAIDHFEQAERFFTTAARSTETWVRDGAAKVREMSSEVRPTSGDSLRAEGGWLAGHIQAQRSDTLLGAAWCYASRYRAHQETAQLMEDLAETLGLKDESAAESEDATVAKENVVASVQDAADALEKAHREAGKHWTFVAQLAAMNDLMALVGFEAYRADALDAYREAINSREQDGYS